MIHIKAEYVYEVIKDGVEERLDISDYEAQRSCPIANNKNVLSMMKAELGGKRMKAKRSFLM